jgi:hypothetical protein
VKLLVQSFVDELVTPLFNEYQHLSKAVSSVAVKLISDTLTVYVVLAG